MVIVTLSLVMAVWWLMGMASSLSECTYAILSTWRSRRRQAQAGAAHG